MNSCAEWFGDVAMKKAEVEALVESVYEGRSSVEVNEAAAAIAESSVFGAYLGRATNPENREKLNASTETKASDDGAQPAAEESDKQKE